MSSARQYRLLRELASGSFGTVYLAEMNAAGGFKKQVALKVLHEGWAASAEATRRFRDEARLLGQIRHRHIVQVDGLFEVNGRWAVVMEYVAGADASAVVKACRRAQETIPVLAALEVTAAVAAALEAAWDARSEAGEPLRVIHRDIKPANIRLTADGDVKVLDFGIAHAQFEEREAETDAVRFGTLRYMAPERRWGKPDTPAGDVYALGCVSYELFAGGPFGNAEPHPDGHAKRIEERLAHVRERLTEEDAEPLLTMFRRMLAYAPEERPTAAEVGASARALCRGRTDTDLSTFSRRFVPLVAQYLPDEGGEIVQHGMGSTGALDSASAPTRRDRAATAARPWLIAGAGALTGAAAIGVGAYGWGQLTNRPLDVEVVVPGATSVDVTCEAASASGVASAALRAPMGAVCQVRANLPGGRAGGEIRVDEAQRRECTAAGETLTCR